LHNGIIIICGIPAALCISLYKCTYSSREINQFTHNLKKKVVPISAAIPFGIPQVGSGAVKVGDYRPLDHIRNRLWHGRLPTLVPTISLQSLSSPEAPFLVPELHSIPLPVLLPSSNTAGVWGYHGTVCCTSNQIFANNHACKLGTGFVLGTILIKQSIRRCIFFPRQIRP
jgi:hypothetical protein